MDKELLELISNCKEYLDEDANKEVWHFFTHGEYEMSLEGLLIEMINLQKYPRNISIDTINELVRYYHLDDESVFDYEFWQKYIEWISET